MRFDVYNYDADQPIGQILVDDRNGDVDEEAIALALHTAGHFDDPDDVDIEEGDEDGAFLVYDALDENPDAKPVLELIETDVIDADTLDEDDEGTHDRH